MAVLRKATVVFLPLFFAAAAAQFFQTPFMGGFSFDDGFGGAPAKKGDYETHYKGNWELVCNNSGVSAMHLVLMPNNKAIMFDTTSSGPSNIKLPPGHCRIYKENNETKKDCWAHGIEYDIHTGFIRTLKVQTDQWCASGSLSADGTLVQTGGSDDGGRAARYLSPCDTCDWTEYPTALSVERWYASQQILPDGSFIVVGGRRQFSYEYVPKPGQSNPTNFKLPFLLQTSDAVEDNLYPFVHLSTDGNLFIFANNRSILLDPKYNSIVRELPPLKGGARNYPGSAMSALLPIDLHTQTTPPPAQVLICGGTPHESAKLAVDGHFLPALRTCGSISITSPTGTWRVETMPTARVMGDMLLLPTADVLLINGAKKGAAGWGSATDPNLEPVMYRPRNPSDKRFMKLRPSAIPRMYHSTSAVLPDGRILVAGSNTNRVYKSSGVAYPTELRVETFSPPYLDPHLALYRPLIVSSFERTVVGYGEVFSLRFALADVGVELSDLKLTMYAPPFTTHGYSMNQRLLILRAMDLVMVGPTMYEITWVAPSTGAIAPPGYYLVFLVHRGVPSEGIWIRIQ
ncbi:hypothetical protein AAC387_Pa03g4047 [Persea americana]